MSRRGVRTLALACCLLLVLPPGWCCWLLLEGSPRAANVAEVARPATAKVAGSCCCQTQEPRPQAPVEGKKLPAPRTPLKQCPCSERQTTPPSFNSVDHDDGAVVVVAILPFSDSAPPVLGGIAAVVPVAHPPDCPIHIRYCVWRC